MILMNDDVPVWFLRFAMLISFISGLALGIILGV